MKLTNNQILSANSALSELVDEKLTGSFKFKIFKIKRSLENEVQSIAAALDFDEDGIPEASDSNNEILGIEQEVDIDYFSVEELSDLPLSIRQISLLDPLIKESEEN